MMMRGKKIVFFDSYKEKYDSLENIMDEITKERDGLVNMLMLVDDDLDYFEKESAITKEVDEALDHIADMREEATKISNCLITSMQDMYLSNIDELDLSNDNENWIYELRVDHEDGRVIFARSLYETAALAAFFCDKESVHPKGYNALSRFRIGNIRNESIDREDYDFDTNEWSATKTISRYNYKRIDK